MPVVIVVVPPHPAVETLLAGVADGIADALALGVGDVIATHVPAGASVLSGGAPAAWPTVLLYGSHRGDERMSAARDAAEDAVRSWCEREVVPCEGVWTQWLTA